jgi:hypothetical protein
MNNTVLITVPEFLRLYAISRTSFYEQVRKNKLAIIKRGRRTLIANDDAAKWVESLRSTSIEGGKNV